MSKNNNFFFLGIFIIILNFKLKILQRLKLFYIGLTANQFLYSSFIMKHTIFFESVEKFLSTFWNSAQDGKERALYLIESTDSKVASTKFSERLLF